MLFYMDLGNCMEDFAKNHLIVELRQVTNEQWLLVVSNKRGRIANISESTLRRSDPVVTPFTSHTVPVSGGTMPTTMRTMVEGCIGFIKKNMNQSASLITTYSAGNVGPGSLSELRRVTAASFIEARVELMRALERQNKEIESITSYTGWVGSICMGTGICMLAIYGQMTPSAKARLQFEQHAFWFYWTGGILIMSGMMCCVPPKALCSTTNASWPSLVLWILSLIAMGGCLYYSRPTHEAIGGAAHIFTSIGCAPALYGLMRYFM